ncbi:MAG: DNA-binding protein [Ignavibacteriaceae bacterium]|nr:DNA-binding protein [Ignavibacteriaceae bacterium]
MFVPNLEYFGNKSILENYKIGFLCSQKVPANIILKTYDWAIKQRTSGNCVISGFHSKIEKDVFDILVKGTQPMIIVLARGIYKRAPAELKREIDKDRLLIISPFSASVKRISSKTSFKRNRIILKLSDEIYLPYVNPQGNLHKLIRKFDTTIKSSKDS